MIGTLIYGITLFYRTADPFISIQRHDPRKKHGLQINHYTLSTERAGRILLALPKSTVIRSRDGQAVEIRLKAYRGHASADYADDLAKEQM